MMVPLYIRTEPGLRDIVRLLRPIFVLLFALQVALLEAHFGLGNGSAPAAVLLIEGFDHLNAAADATSKGWSVAPGGGFTAGRWGGQAFRAGTSISTKSFTASSTVIVGFAWRNSTSGAKAQMVMLRASTTNVCRFTVNASNQIAILNSGGTTIATGTTALATSTWYYIEMKCFVNAGTPASGNVTVQLNGASEIAQTNGNFGSTNMDNIGIVGISGQTTDFDDIYVVDTTGSAPRNTFLGDVRVQTEVPNGAGNYTQFTANGAATNFGCVDETLEDGDTTYVSDSTVGHRDSYTYADIDGGSTIYGVQVTTWARKDDAGTRQLAPFIRQAGVDYDGTAVAQGSSYAGMTQIYNQDPTNADWTPATLNGDEFGVKVIA